MTRIRFIIFMSLLLATLSSYAEASLTLVPPRHAIEGQRFTVTFRLTDADGASGIQAPEIENCTMLYGPSTSTMQSTQIINGKRTSTGWVDYTFTYRADKAGNVTIPAVTVSAGGKSLSSKSASLNILPAEGNGSNNNQAGSSQGSNNDQSGSSNGSASAAPADMFVRIILNKSTVYEQEPVVVTVKVYFRNDIRSFQIKSQPTFEGFLTEELPVNNDTDMENYNGKNYYTAMLKKCIVYPQKEGTLTITSGEYQVTILDRENVSNGFWVTQRLVERDVNTKSNSATVKVLPLPTPKPDGFNGAVGNYSADVEMKPTQLKTNEATSYILTIKGTGNIKYLKTPTLDVPAGIDQYTPKTDIDAHFTGNNMQGTYSVNYTLVPQEPGNFEIDPSKFIYFNPSNKEYHTIDLRGFDLKVAQGTNITSVTEQKAIAKGMTDILHIKPAEGTLSLRHTLVFNSWGYWLLYVALTLALAIIFIIYRRQLKINADVKGRKLAQANKQASKRLKTAREAMDKHDAPSFYKALNSAMWGYLSDKLGIPSSQLVRDNISSQLADYGLSREGIDDTIAVLDECEMARFTPEHSDAEMSSIYSRAAAAIKAIEQTKAQKTKIKTDTSKA